jgi:hypothetical protein
VIAIRETQPETLGEFTADSGLSGAGHADEDYTIRLLH